MNRPLVALMPGPELTTKDLAMQTSNNSQCQLFQLHIDAFLDNELEAARSADFQAHMAGCQACRQELDFARQLHRSVISLPILDCSDQALEPVDRLFEVVAEPAANPWPATPVGQRNPGGFRHALETLLRAIPLPVRVGVPLAAALLLAVGPGRGLLVPGPAPEIASQLPTDNGQPRYTQEEIVQAMQDLELALNYLGQISARTEVMIENRFLLRQLESSINASFSEDPRSNSGDEVNDGPI